MTVSLPLCSFGLDEMLTTPDVILSLVRTTRVGYLRDIRRLTVALSRARLGLYILGRREVFEASYELKPAFDILLQRPDKLALVTNEMYPTARALDDEAASTEMEGVEHLGQYVFEMTQAKVNALKANGGVLPPIEQMPKDDEDMDVDEVEEEEGDDAIAIDEELEDEEEV